MTELAAQSLHRGLDPSRIGQTLGVMDPRLSREEVPVVPIAQGLLAVPDLGKAVLLRLRSPVAPDRQWCMSL
jgi:hypothetical protein